MIKSLHFTNIEHLSRSVNWIYWKLQIKMSKCKTSLIGINWTFVYKLTWICFVIDKCWCQNRKINKPSTKDFEKVQLPSSLAVIDFFVCHPYNNYNSCEYRNGIDILMNWWKLIFCVHTCKAINPTMHWKLAINVQE